MIIEATAPTRVDLAGGTIDIWPLYLFHPGATTVSAGMSNDLEQAVSAGATHVRIGRAVLGERAPNG